MYNCIILYVNYGGIVNINAVSSSLVRIDQFFDQVPVLCAVNNVVNVFLKSVVLPFMKQADIEASQYYSHLQSKTYGRCFRLLNPLMPVLDKIDSVVMGIFKGTDMCNLKALPLDPEQVDANTEKAIALPVVERLYVRRHTPQGGLREDVFAAEIKLNNDPEVIFAEEAHYALESEGSDQSLLEAKAIPLTDAEVMLMRVQEELDEEDCVYISYGNGERISSAEARVAE